jgi:transposase
VNKQTGEATEVEVFVAILPCSQYTYVEACISQKRGDFLSGTRLQNLHRLKVENF